MKKPDGGFAFSQYRYSTDKSGQVCGLEITGGISRRQWLAGLAMEGVILATTVHSLGQGALQWPSGSASQIAELGDTSQHIAEIAFALADAIIAFEAAEEKKP